MSELDPEYVSAITSHLEQRDEASLSHGYELGRDALARGLGILDLLSLYETIQKELILPAPSGDQARIAATIGDFFREVLSPFEMSLRGYREANAELRRVNEDLKRAYAELQSKQLQLVQSAKMASLGELVAGIAHEINNPLAFVASHVSTAKGSVVKAQAALGGIASPAVVDSLQRAQDRLLECQAGTERIQELVLKLRTFSRLDEGERKTVSISECVSSVLTILRHRFGERIQVRNHVGHPDFVECYPSLLNQALLNLISNSIDSIAETGTISITTGADGDAYVIVVEDTGHGIPEELRMRVFEPFFTTKPVGTGTGLGLSITYSIVQAHGGTLELTPREGGGTLATIRFPLDRAAPSG